MLNGNAANRARLSAHKFDLAQIELQRRQLQQLELRRNKEIFESTPKGKRTEDLIRRIIDKFTVRIPIRIQPLDKDGIYLGMFRKSKRDPLKLYKGTSTCFEFGINSRLRSKIISIVESIYFELFILLIIFINTIIIACDNPLHPPSEFTEYIFKTLDIIFICIYTVEMMLKMIASGVIFNGTHSYLHSCWNKLDFLVVVLGFIEFIPGDHTNFSGIRAIRVLRPLRSINSIPGMKILVTSLLASLHNMGNVLLLCFFMFLFFGLLGMQFFAGKLQQHCFNTVTKTFNTERAFLCGASDVADFQCSDPNEICMASGENPNYGIIGFDNIAMSWLTVLQCISLEGWSDVAYQISETTNQISVFYFIILIFFGAFVVVNLVVGVIVTAYEAEKERQQMLSKQISKIRTIKTMLKAKAKDLIRHTVAVQKGAKSLFHSVRKPKKINGNESADSDQDLYDENEPIILNPGQRGRKEKSWWYELEMRCFELSETKRFGQFIMFLIILNTLVLACEMVNEPKEWTLFQDIANYIFTTLFVIEVIIKICGYGLSQYFDEQFNRFDFVIVILNVFEILFDKFLHVDELKGLSAFRAFRLIKVFRLARSWSVLRDLLATIAKSLSSLVYFSFVLLLFIFIYGLLGMQFFAGKMYVDDEKTEISRSNFDTFWWSIVSVFQIIGGENWNEILFVTMHNTNAWLGIGFCVSLYVLGNYVLLNLFLAILLSNFDDLAKPEDDDDGDDLNDVIETSPSRKPLKSSPKRKKMTRKERNLYLDPIGYTLKHKNRTLRESITDIFRNEEPIKIERGRSLIIFGSKNCIRLKCSWLIQQPFFEFLVLMTIVFSSTVLILDTPNLSEESMIYRFLYISELISVGIFSVEALLKIIANGLIFPSSAYLKDGWNLIDLTAIIFSVLDLFVGHLSFLRVVRAFRALRIIRRIEGMRVVTIAIVQSIKPVFNVILISFLFYFVFGILGVQIFKGKFMYCQDANGNDLGFDKVDCTAASGGEWRNPAFGNFDHIGNALLILFDISTLEMWPNIMYRGVDVTETNLAPSRDNRPYYALYFILFIICTNFFIMNLFVGVVVDHFNSAKNRLEGGLLTVEQQQWVHLKKWISSDTSDEDRYYFNYRPNIGDPTNPNYNYFKFVNYKIQKRVFKFITNPKFDYFIMICILLNTLILLTWSFRQPAYMELFQWISSKVFTAIFTVEMLLKIYGLGVSQYFSSKANIFDFVIVIGSILGMAFEGLPTEGIQKLAAKSDRSFDPTMFRVFRILRLLRLVQRAKGLKVLIQTLIYAMPSLSNIGCLLSLIFFIYAILGMGLFGGIAHNDDANSFINIHCNFDNFYNSIITLFRIATGESWNGIMRQLLPWECTFMNKEIDNVQCGSYVAPVYFISFIVVVMFIVLNVFIAVILEQFENSLNDITNSKNFIKQSDVESFDKCWKSFVKEGYKWYRPHNDDYLWIKVQDFEVMLAKTKGKFGFQNKNWSRVQRFKFMKQLKIPLHRKAGEEDHILYVNYCQCLLAMGLIFMIKENGKWIQSQITRNGQFAKIAVHRKTDWKIAKKLLQTNATSIKSVKLIQIISAIKIQAMIRGYLCRKKLRKELWK